MPVAALALSVTALSLLQSLVVSALGPIVDLDPPAGCPRAPAFTVLSLFGVVSCAAVAGAALVGLLAHPRRRTDELVGVGGPPPGRRVVAGLRYLLPRNPVTTHRVVAWNDSLQGNGRTTAAPTATHGRVPNSP